MEILFKVYTDKPSRLGIKYPYVYQALKEYEAIISKCRDHAFTIKAEVVNNKLNLLLISEQDGTKFNYNALEFKPELLRKLSNANSSQSIEFVHVYMDGNQPFIIKPFNKIKFVNVISIEMIGAGYFA